MDSIVPADHRVKVRVDEKPDKHLKIVKEVKEWGYMKVSVIPILVGVLVTVLDNLKRDWVTWHQRKNQVNLDHSTVKISWNTKKSVGNQICYRSDFTEKPPIRAGGKTCKRHDNNEMLNLKK